MTETRSPCFFRFNSILAEKERDFEDQRQMALDELRDAKDMELDRAVHDLEVTMEKSKAQQQLAVSGESAVAHSYY